MRFTVNKGVEVVYTAHVEFQSNPENPCAVMSCGLQPINAFINVSILFIFFKKGAQMAAARHLAPLVCVCGDGLPPLCSLGSVDALGQEL